MAVRDAYYSQPGSGYGYSTFALKTPQIYSIEVTSWCNFQCSFCDRGHYPDTFLDLQLAQTIADRDLGGSKFVEFQMTGEPTLHKQFNEIVDIFAGKVFLGTSTNGSNIIPALEGLMKLHYITISIDSVTNYEQVRKGGNWGRLVKGLLALFEAKGKSKFPKIDLQLIELNEVDTVKERDLLALMIDTWGYSDRCVIRTIPDCFGAVQGREEMKPKKELCLDPWVNVVVQADGDVVPCCMAFDKSLKLGNLNEQSLAEIWQTSPRLKLLREEHMANTLPSRCSKCTMRSPCLLHEELLWSVIKEDLLQRPADKLSERHANAV